MPKNKAGTIKWLRFGVRCHSGTGGLVIWQIFIKWHLITDCLIESWAINNVKMNEINFKNNKGLND